MRKLNIISFLAVSVLNVMFTDVVSADQNCTGWTYYDSDSETCVACENQGFTITTTNLPNNTEFWFSMSPKGSFAVDWGDGNIDNINRVNTTASQYTHLYSTGGVKTIKFCGKATEYDSAEGDNVVAAITFYKSTDAQGSQIRIASVSGSLWSVFPTIGGGTNADQQPRFRSTFQGANNLTTISATLFSGYTTGARQMFDSTFSGCSSLESIPATLFSNITSGAREMFENTFAGCSSASGYISYQLFAGLIANNSPYETDMMKNIFSDTSLLATECPCTTKQYITGYESYWSSRIACGPATEYTINYVMNGGTNYAGAPTSYFDDDCITRIDGTPTKANAGFIGWCTDSTLQNCALTHTIPTGTTGNKTFYAKWLVCTGATFYDSAAHACVACPAYYDYNTASGKTDVTQCQIRCPAGKFVEVPGVYGYVPLEYLESSGGQYINTGLTHVSSNIRGVIRVGASHPITTNVNIIGNQGTGVGYSVGWNNVFKVWVESSSNRLNGPPKALITDGVYDIEYELTANRRYLTYDGVTVDSAHNGSIVTDVPIHLFDNGAHQMEQNFAGRVYFIKIYEDGTMTHNFIPVRRNSDDGAIGMYDTVTNSFFQNSGSGNFIPGDDVSDPCVNAGLGNYANLEVVNFGSVGSRTACPAGTYSNIETGSSLASCLACQGATYSTGTGAAECSPCPTGYNYNDTPGKTSVNQCQIHCEAGTYLPSAISTGYTELEYIRTTGSQYIDIGEHETNKRFYVSQLVNPITSMTMEYVDVETGKQSGANKGNQSFKWGISNSGVFLCQSAGANKEVTFGAADTNKHTFTLNTQNGTCTMDNTTKNLEVSGLSNLTANITLNAVSGASNRIGKIKIYDFELISNNNVIRSMVPARNNTTGVIGMLDTVNNKFYTNQGSGTFVAGPDVNVQLCTDVGIGYWASDATVNYGSGAPRTQCEAGKTTMVTNATNASQCVDEVHTYNVTYSCGGGTGTPPAAAVAMDATQFTPAANPCSRA